MKTLNYILQKYIVTYTTITITTTYYNNYTELVTLLQRYVTCLEIRDHVGDFLCVGIMIQWTSAAAGFGTAAAGVTPTISKRQ